MFLIILIKEKSTKTLVEKMMNVNGGGCSSDFGVIDASTLFSENHRTLKLYVVVIFYLACIILYGLSDFRETIEFLWVHLVKPGKNGQLLRKVIRSIFVRIRVVQLSSGPHFRSPYDLGNLCDAFFQSVEGFFLALALREVLEGLCLDGRFFLVKIADGSDLLRGLGSLHLAFEASKEVNALWVRDLDKEMALDGYYLSLIVVFLVALLVATHDTNSVDLLYVS